MKGKREPTESHRTDRDKAWRISDEAIFGWLTAYYLHQDQLSWSRTQTIVAIEAAFLSAAFVLDGRSSAIPLVVGSAVIWMFWQLFSIDWEIRDQHAYLLESALARHDVRIIDPRRGRRRRIRLGGTGIVRGLIWGIIAINVCLAGLFLGLGSADFMNW